jgi:hypothetical protein
MLLVEKASCGLVSARKGFYTALVKRDVVTRFNGGNKPLPHYARNVIRDAGSRFVKGGVKGNQL